MNLTVLNRIDESCLDKYYFEFDPSGGGLAVDLYRYERCILISGIWHSDDEYWNNGMEFGCKPDVPMDVVSRLITEIWRFYRENVFDRFLVMGWTSDEGLDLVKVCESEDEAKDEMYRNAPNYEHMRWFSMEDTPIPIGLL